MVRGRGEAGAEKFAMPVAARRRQGARSELALQLTALQFDEWLAFTIVGFGQSMLFDLAFKATHVSFLYQGPGLPC
jgi:hypothetical protein